MHDPTLERTTDGKGLVRAQSLVDLRALDAGANFSTDGGATFPFRGQGLRVPTLGEVLWAFPRMSHAGRGEGAGGAGGGEAGAGPGGGGRSAASSRRSTGRRSRRSASRHSRAPRRRRRSRSCTGVSCFGGRCRRRATISCRSRSAIAGSPCPRGGSWPRPASFGCPVHVWTINDAATARRLWGRGVAGVVTNLPAAMVAARST